ncbi:hypothetical protein V0P10_22115 [Burkholderia stagnalis]
MRNDLARVLGDVRASVEDWPKIVDIARGTIKDLKGRETSAEDIEAREERKLGDGREAVERAGMSR